MTTVEPNWLGDPARFPNVLDRLRNETPINRPLVLEEQLAAQWVGYVYGHRRLLQAAELIVRCTDCNATPVLAVTHIGGLPLISAVGRGDRITREDSPRSWGFQWIFDGVVAHARCNYRYTFDLEQLKRLTPSAGKHRHPVRVSHTAKGGPVR